MADVHYSCDWSGVPRTINFNIGGELASLRRPSHLKWTVLFGHRTNRRHNSGGPRQKTNLQKSTQPQRKWNMHEVRRGTPGTRSKRKQSQTIKRQPISLQKTATAQQSISSAELVLHRALLCAERGCRARLLLRLQPVSFWATSPDSTPRERCEPSARTADRRMSS